MIPGKKYGPEEIIQILWRRKWFIILPTLVSGLGIFAYTRTLPNKYRSETLVMIQPQRVREDLIRSAAVENPTDRIQTITQQVMSRTRLEAIITDLNLYEAERRRGLMEDVVECMRRDVTVDGRPRRCVPHLVRIGRPGDGHEGHRTSRPSVHRREPARPRDDGPGHQPVPRIPAGRCHGGD